MPHRPKQRPDRESRWGQVARGNTWGFNAGRNSGSAHQTYRYLLQQFPSRGGGAAAPLARIVSTDTRSRSRGMCARFFDMIRRFSQESEPACF